MQHLTIQTASVCPRLAVLICFWVFPLLSSCAGSTDIPIKLPQLRDNPLLGKGIKQQTIHAINAAQTRQQTAISRQEMVMAKVAWRYFEKNYQPSTGLINAADNYPSTTCWDIASSMGALVAAYELAVIDKLEFELRMVRLLKTLNNLPFFQNILPHKVYHTQTLQKVDYANRPSEIGFSGLDLGRLLIWLKIIQERYPEYSPSIIAFVARWDFKPLFDSAGHIYGASRTGKDGSIALLQEGRLGYEEYATKGFNLWGYNTVAAAQAEPYDIIEIYGIDIPFDARRPEHYYAHNSVVLESYLLDALEFNWDLPDDKETDDDHHSHPWQAEVADRIYQVQERRYHKTGIMTARTEHQLEQTPYFVYDSIYSDGIPWATITEKCEQYPKVAAVALKAVIAMKVIWHTQYSDLLFSHYADQYDTDNGFYEGVYENGNGVIKKFTANNNGVILEALLYKAQGKLLRPR